MTGAETHLGDEDYIIVYETDDGKRKTVYVDRDTYNSLDTGINLMVVEYIMNLLTRIILCLIELSVVEELEVRNVKMVWYWFTYSIVSRILQLHHELHLAARLLG